MNEVLEPNEAMIQVQQQQKETTEIDGVPAEDLHELEGDLPDKPLFPIMITLVALTKDGIDVLSLGTVGWLGTIILWVILWFWMSQRASFMYRYLWRWFLRRGIFLLLLGFIPILNAIPEATILVLLIHHQENKVVVLVYSALEKTRIGG